MIKVYFVFWRLQINLTNASSTFLNYPSPPKLDFPTNTMIINNNNSFQQNYNIYIYIYIRE